VKKERIGYDALLEDVLRRGQIPPDVDAEARRALSDGSQLEKWRAVIRSLEALRENGLLRRHEEPGPAGSIRYIDLERALIITVAPPPVPVRDHTISVAPRIPESIRARDRLAMIDPILTSVATCQSEAELGGAIENIERFLREVLPGHVSTVIPFTARENAGPEGPARLSTVIREGSELADYVRRLVVAEGRALHFADLAEEAHLAPQLIDPSLRTAALFPLRTGGETFGVLEAWHPSPGALSEDDLGFLALLATIAGGLVKNARRLEHLLFMDPLTGVHTRGYFEAEFDREIERSNRTGQSLALLMIDVDDFKGVNDTHGHAAGDSALKTVAEILKDRVRQVDVVTRYGGEEFAVLLPGATEEVARRAAERLRAVVEATRITVSDSRLLRLTISIGGALYPEHAKSRDELLDLADRIALLTAKRQGKNRVVFWHPGLDERPH